MGLGSEGHRRKSLYDMGEAEGWTPAYKVGPTRDGTLRSYTRVESTEGEGFLSALGLGEGSKNKVSLRIPFFFFF